MARSRQRQPETDPDGRLFEEAMRDVEPLAEEGAGVIVPRVRRRRSQLPLRTAAPAPLRVERFGESLEALAPGVDRRQLRRLRRGDPPVDLELDLHGLDEEQARRRVRDALARALAAGLRCLRIVHGRGLRSAAGPVLKEALPGWLAEAPHGRRVLAFTSAPPEQGGPGATLVLLKGRRRRR